MQRGAGQDLVDAIRLLAGIRHRSEALRHGDYLQLKVASEQLAFIRRTSQEAVVVAVNAATETEMDLTIPDCGDGVLVDLLNPPGRFDVKRGQVRIDVPGTWARVLRLER